jgi:hypothetical protein
MAQDKDNKKNDPMERVREASARLGVPFKDVTEEKQGQRTLIFGFGGRRAREERGNEER